MINSSISKIPNADNNQDEAKLLYEVNTNTNKYFHKWIREIKRKYKLSLFFDLINLFLSTAFCVTTVISNYSPSFFHMNEQYFYYSFCSIIYFLVDYLFNCLTYTIENKYEFITYNIVEIITIIPYLVVRIIFGMNEDLLSDGHKLTTALVTIRILRIEYLGKYIVCIFVVFFYIKILHLIFFYF